MTDLQKRIFIRILDKIIVETLFMKEKYFVIIVWERNFQDKR